MKFIVEWKTGRPVQNLNADLSGIPQARQHLFLEDNAFEMSFLLN